MGGTINIKSLLAMPEFHDLPLAEKYKGLMETPEFSSLPGPERARALNDIHYNRILGPMPEEKPSPFDYRGMGGPAADIMVRGVKAAGNMLKEQLTPTPDLLASPGTPVGEAVRYAKLAKKAMTEGAGAAIEEAAEQSIPFPVKRIAERVGASIDDPHRSEIPEAIGEGGLAAGELYVAGKAVKAGKTAGAEAWKVKQAKLHDERASNLGSALEMGGKSDKGTMTWEEVTKPITSDIRAEAARQDFTPNKVEGREGYTGFRRVTQGVRKLYDRAFRVIIEPIQGTAVSSSKATARRLINEMHKDATLIGEIKNGPQVAELQRLAQLVEEADTIGKMNDLRMTLNELAAKYEGKTGEGQFESPVFQKMLKSAADQIRDTLYPEVAKAYGNTMSADDLREFQKRHGAAIETDNMMEKTGKAISSIASEEASKPSWWERLRGSAYRLTMSPPHAAGGIIERLFPPSKVELFNTRIKRVLEGATKEEGQVWVEDQPPTAPPDVTSQVVRPELPPGKPPEPEVPPKPPIVTPIPAGAVAGSAPTSPSTRGYPSEAQPEAAYGGEVRGAKGYWSQIPRQLTAGEGVGPIAAPPSPLAPGVGSEPTPTGGRRGFPSSPQPPEGVTPRSQEPYTGTPGPAEQPSSKPRWRQFFEDESGNMDPVAIKKAGDELAKRFGKATNIESLADFTGFIRADGKVVAHSSGKTHEWMATSVGFKGIEDMGRQTGLVRIGRNIDEKTGEPWGPVHYEIFGKPTEQQMRSMAEGAKRSGSQLAVDIWGKPGELPTFSSKAVSVGELQRQIELNFPENKAIVKAKAGQTKSPTTDLEAQGNLPLSDLAGPTSRRGFLQKAIKGVAGAMMPKGIVGEALENLVKVEPGKTPMVSKELVQDVWDRLDLSGDDDVDYNGSYLGIFGDALKEYVKEKGVTKPSKVSYADLDKYMDQYEIAEMKEDGDYEPGSSAEMYFESHNKRVASILKDHGIYPSEDGGGVHFDPQKIGVLEGIMELIHASYDRFPVSKKLYDYFQPFIEKAELIPGWVSEYQESLKKTEEPLSELSGESESKTLTEGEITQLNSDLERLGDMTSNPRVKDVISKSASLAKDLKPGDYITKGKSKVAREADVDDYLRTWSHNIDGKKYEVFIKDVNPEKGLLTFSVKSGEKVIDVPVQNLDLAKYIEEGKSVPKSREGKTVYAAELTDLSKLVARQVHEKSIVGSLKDLEKLSDLSGKAADIIKWNTMESLKPHGKVVGDKITLSEDVYLYRGDDPKRVAKGIKSYVSEDLRDYIIDEGLDIRAEDYKGVYLASKEHAQPYGGEGKNLIKIRIPKGTELTLDPYDTDAVIYLGDIPKEWMSGYQESLKKTKKPSKAELDSFFSDLEEDLSKEKKQFGSVSELEDLYGKDATMGRGKHPNFGKFYLKSQPGETVYWPIKGLKGEKRLPAGTQGTYVWRANRSGDIPGYEITLSRYPADSGKYGSQGYKWLIHEKSGPPYKLMYSGGYYISPFEALRYLKSRFGIEPPKKIHPAEQDYGIGENDD